MLFEVLYDNNLDDYKILMLIFVFDYLEIS